MWEVTTGLLLATTTAANGVPPQIRTLRWCDKMTNTSYISSDNDGTDSYFICTAGERYVSRTYILILILINYIILKQ